MLMAASLFRTQFYISEKEKHTANIPALPQQQQPNTMKRSLFSVLQQEEEVNTLMAKGGEPQQQQQRMRKRQRCSLSIDLSSQHPNETLYQLYFTQKQQKAAAAATPQPTVVDDARLANYTLPVVNAIRSNNVEQLQQMLAEGHCFDACNNQGEHLIHLACRRGNLQTIHFLVNDAGVNLHVCDNMGRSILHDLCWRPKAETELLQVLLPALNPALLITKDVRGHTPLDYSRARDWAQWNTFLTQGPGAALLRQRLQATASN